MTRIEEIRERLSKATPGPWEGSVPYTSSYGFEIEVSSERPHSVWTAKCQYSNDAHLIANAPQDLAYLLDRVEKLEAVCEAAKEADASIPATYDEKDPMVIRHARALIQLNHALTKLKEEVFV